MQVKQAQHYQLSVPQTVDDLEQALFASFPRADMEKWDSCGLIVGDRQAQISSIAIALDFTINTLQAAIELGCNVLVTHHPAYIGQGPKELGPANQLTTQGCGQALFEAAKRGLSVINMHTNLDRSVLAREHFAQALKCECKSNFEYLIDHRRSAAGTGFGAVLSLPALTSLNQLASICDDAFGGHARVWGDPEDKFRTCAYLNGSWRDVSAFMAAIAAQIDCVIVGETSYHSALDVYENINIIELGHDVSELPLTKVLFNELSGYGYNEKTQLHIIGEKRPIWWQVQR